MLSIILECYFICYGHSLVSAIRASLLVGYRSAFASVLRRASDSLGRILHYRLVKSVNLQLVMFLLLLIYAGLFPAWLIFMLLGRPPCMLIFYWG